MRKSLCLLAMLLALTACGTPTIKLGSPHVDFDTPALRALRQQAGIAPCQAATAAPAEHGLPDYTLPCIGGGPGVAMARLRGPLVVNLWAQSCVPCRTELPHLEAFSKKYAGKVAVLGVDWQDGLPLAALELAKKSGVTYPLVGDIWPRIRTSALPTTILIDADGNIAYQQPTIIESVAQLETLVREHLGVTG